MAEKIIFTTAVPRSGLGTYVEFLSNELRKKKYDFKLVQFVYCKNRLTFDNAHAKNGFIVMNNSWFINDLLRLQDKALLKNIDKDTKLIHFSDSQSLPSVKVLKDLKKRKIKLVCTVHDMIDALIGRYNYEIEEPKLLKLIRKILKKDRTSVALSHLERLSYMDFIATQSESARQDLMMMFTLLKIPFDNSKIQAIYRGYNKDVFKPLKSAKKDLRKKLGLPIGKKILFYNGSEEPRKNVATLYAALSDLPDEYFLVRNGHTSKSNQELIDRLGIRKRIKFFDKVTNETLVEIFNASDTFVFTSIFEGMGMPPLEAMACGIPVVSTDKTSIIEVVGNSALIIDDPYDSNLVREKIIEMMRKDVYSHYAKKGLHNANDNKWFMYYEKITRVYSNLLSRR